MSFSWKVIETGLLSAEAIMAKDALLLKELNSKSPCILHFYEWAFPCVTFGYFTKLSDHINLIEMDRCGLQAARRPTGGGILFHLTDFAFSVLIPANHPHFSFNTLENYAYINQKIAESITLFTQRSYLPHLFESPQNCLNEVCQGFCMAKPTQYDIIIEGKKVGGAAQRRTRNGLLHQASLSLAFPPIDLLQKVLKNHDIVIESMKMHSFCLMKEPFSYQELPKMRQEIKEYLKIALMSC